MAKHGWGGWDTAPSCIQHNIPGADGVYKPYEKCADFFTFAPGSKVGTLADGVSSTFWAVTVIGFLVSIAFLVWWVMLEDRKLKAQAAHLLQAGIGASTTPGAPR